jgi:hypothetical protein
LGSKLAEIEPEVATTAVGAEGEFVNVVLRRVMKGAPLTELEVSGLPVVGVTVAVIVPTGMATRTFGAGAVVGAFWCGFQRDGSSQASNWVAVLQHGLKTSLFRYGRFSIPASS